MPPAEGRGVVCLTQAGQNTQVHNMIVVEHYRNRTPFNFYYDLNFHKNCFRYLSLPIPFLASDTAVPTTACWNGEKREKQLVFTHLKGDFPYEMTNKSRLK